MRSPTTKHNYDPINKSITFVTNKWCLGIYLLVGWDGPGDIASIREKLSLVSSCDISLYFPAINQDNYLDCRLHLSTVTAPRGIHT